MKGDIELDDGPMSAVSHWRPPDFPQGQYAVKIVLEDPDPLKFPVGAQDIAAIHGRFPPVFLFRCQPSVTVRKNKPRGGINEALSMFRPVRNAPLGSPLPPREWSDE